MSIWLVLDREGVASLEEKQGDYIKPKATLKKEKESSLKTQVEPSGKRCLYKTPSYTNCAVSGMTEMSAHLLGLE
jgi:hypothetical protein